MHLHSLSVDIMSIARDSNSMLMREKMLFITEFW